MDWFLYDRDLRHERVNIGTNCLSTTSCMSHYFSTLCIKGSKVTTHFEHIFPRDSFCLTEEICELVNTLALDSLYADSLFTNIAFNETTDICINPKTDTAEGFTKSKLSGS